MLGLFLLAFLGLFSHRVRVWFRSFPPRGGPILFANHRWFEDDLSSRRDVHHCECGLVRVRQWAVGAHQPDTQYYHRGEDFPAIHRSAGPCPRILA